MGACHCLNTVKDFDWLVALGNFLFWTIHLKNEYIYHAFHTFFSNDPLLPKLMNIFLFKYWLKCWGLSISQSCKRFWLANRIWKTSIMNRTPEISLFLTLISYFFRTTHFCQKSWRYSYSNTGQNFGAHHCLNTVKGFDWLIALRNSLFWTVYLKKAYI